MRVFKRRRGRRDNAAAQAGHAWASAGTRLTFRAELMPGRDTAQRTFTVASVLTNGRVELKGLAGEHAESEFEARR
ncbi:MAG TPA: hypothetical protein VJT09_03305 [Pyrinomonadaceae bacterium]|nr:hypothetical protein [Pyrinomonadaceae bacterium]